ncbi:monocarboxylate transporter 9-like [Centruroides sculpturatus]|uniref:monocarboxylate transporter 9-like n=1 Tax=Centruroides sculpturatus TaxID=218467 RepID=UPI000C6CE299|nr:monocarboxylate transporter 9-like [Centruroides sculpturatus]
MKLRKPDEGWAWIFLAASFCCSVLVIGMIMGSSGVLFFAITTKFHVPRRQSAWPFTVRKFSSAISALCTGFLSHFIKLKTLVFIGVTISTIGLAGCYFISSILAISILYGALLGKYRFGVGMINNVNIIMVNRCFKKYRTVAVGVVYAGVSTGEIIFPIISSILIDTYEIQGCFLLLSGFLMQAFVAISLYPHPPPLEQSKNETTNEKNVKIVTVLLSFLELFRTVMFHIIWITIAVYSLTYIIYFTIVMDYAIDCGISKSTAIYIPSTISITVLCGRLCCGWLIDLRWMNRKTMVALAFFLQASTYVIIPFWKTQIAFFVTACCIGFTVSCLSINVSPLYTDYLGLKNLPLGIGTGKALNGFLHFSSPSILGYFRDVGGNYDAMFFYFGGVCLMASVTWLIEPIIIKVTTKKSMEPQNST